MWFSRTAGSSSSSSTERSILTPQSCQPRAPYIPVHPHISPYIPVYPIDPPIYSPPQFHSPTPGFRTHLPHPRRHPPYHNTHDPHHLRHQLGIVRKSPIPARHKVPHDQRQQRPHLQIDLGGPCQRRQQFLERRRRRCVRAEDAPDERERGLIDRSSGGRECGCRGGCYSGGGGRGGGGEIPRHGLAGRSHGVGGGWGEGGEGERGLYHCGRGGENWRRVRVCGGEVGQRSSERSRYDTIRGGDGWTLAGVTGVTSRRRVTGRRDSVCRVHGQARVASRPVTRSTATSM